MDNQNHPPKSYERIKFIMQAKIKKRAASVETSNDPNDWTSPCVTKKFVTPGRPPISSDSEDEEDDFDYFSPGLNESEKTTSVNLDDEDDWSWVGTSTSAQITKPTKSSVTLGGQGWFPKVQVKESSNKDNEFQKFKKKLLANPIPIRPQDQFPGLAKAMRRVNWKLVDPTDNPQTDAIKNSKLSDKDFVARKRWEIYPKTQGKPKPRWISTPQHLRKLIGILENESEFSLDLEFHNIDSKEGYVSLIQVSTWDHGDFFIDPFPLIDLIKKELKSILESDQITKILHACTNDVLMLRKCFGINLVKVMDAQILYQIDNGGHKPKFENMALAFYPDQKELLSVVETHSDFRLRGPNFTEAQQIYATNDCHFLLRVFDKMRNTCLENGEDGKNVLEHAFEESKGECVVKLKLIKKYEQELNKKKTLEQMVDEYYQDAMKNLNKDNYCKKYVSRLKDEEIALMKLFLEWRHQLGNIVDQEDNWFLADSALLKIVWFKPQNVDALKALLGKNFSYYIERQGRVIIRLIEGGIEAMKKLRNTECFNCLEKGHPAFACWEPETKNVYYNLPENRDKKLALRKRRRQNLARKKYALRLEKNVGRKYNPQNSSRTFYRTNKNNTK